MKNGKIVCTLLSGIAVLGVAHVMLSRSGVGTQLVRRTTLRPGVERVDAIRLVRAEAPEIRLVRSGERWRLESPFAGSADTPVVMRLLDTLTQTPVQDAISDAELLRLGRSRADFALEEPELTVSVSAAGASERFIFGMPTPAGRGVYAAVEGVSSVYVVSTNAYAALDLGVESLRRRSLFTSTPTSVASFEIKRANGGLMRFARAGEQWKVNDSAASTPEVGRFLDALVAAQAVSFEWPKGATNEADSASAALLAVYGLDPQSALTVTLTDADGTDSRVSFGLDAGKNLVYALVQDGDAIVTVPSALSDAAERGSHAFVDARLLPVEATSVRSYSLTCGDTTCLVARGDEGTWRLDAPISAPADAAFAVSVLDKLLTLTSADLAQTGVAVSIATNQAPLTVKAASVLGAGRLEDFRSRDLLAIDPALVRRLVATPRDKPAVAVVYARDKRAWLIEANPAHSAEKTSVPDAKAIADILARLNPLRAVRVEKLRVTTSDLQRFGLSQPALTLAVDQDREDAVRRNILIGAHTQGGFFATVGSSDAVFVLSDETVGVLTHALIER